MSGVEITQADRDAAENARSAMYDSSDQQGIERLFAQHRIQARKDALEDAARVADTAAAAKDCKPQFGGYARAEKNEAERLATAIRTLTQPTKGE